MKIITNSKKKKGQRKNNVNGSDMSKLFYNSGIIYKRRKLKAHI